MTGWVGVDLDGTLAFYDHWSGEDHIGQPVPKMQERVKRWLAEGVDVRIVTARVSDTTTYERSMRVIEAWCVEHLGKVLMVTCSKDYAMMELWDDRCVQVIPNTGEPVGASTRGLS